MQNYINIREYGSNLYMALKDGIVALYPYHSHLPGF